MDEWMNQTTWNRRIEDRVCWCEQLAHTHAIIHIYIKRAVIGPTSVSHFISSFLPNTLARSQFSLMEVMLSCTVEKESMYINDFSTCCSMCLEKKKRLNFHTDNQSAVAPVPLFANKNGSSDLMFFQVCSMSAGSINKIVYLRINWMNWCGGEIKVVPFMCLFEYEQSFKMYKIGQIKHFLVHFQMKMRNEKAKYHVLSSCHASARTKIEYSIGGKEADFCGKSQPKKVSVSRNNEQHVLSHVAC